MEKQAIKYEGKSISIHKYLNHYIVINETKVITSFILQAMNDGITYKGVFRNDILIFLEDITI